MRAFAVIAVAALLTSCSHKTVVLNYQDLSVSDKNEMASSQKDLGEVVGKYSGHAWDSCEEVTKSAAQKMLANARARGANAVVSLEWKKKDFYVKTPTCKKSYGWFALYILGGLGPWVTSAEVKGRAVVVDKSEVQRPATKKPTKKKKPLLLR